MHQTLTGPVETRQHSPSRQSQFAAGDRVINLTSLAPAVVIRPGTPFMQVRIPYANGRSQRRYVVAANYAKFNDNTIPPDK